MFGLCVFTFSFLLQSAPNSKMKTVHEHTNVTLHSLGSCLMAKRNFSYKNERENFSLHLMISPSGFTYVLFLVFAHFIHLVLFPEVIMFL